MGPAPTPLRVNSGYGHAYGHYRAAGRAVGIYPASMRVRNGEGSEFGDMAGRRGDREATAVVEDIVCKRCSG